MSNLVADLQVLALRAVLADDSDYRLRVIYRWYSREFSVPLPEVPALPLTHVLQAYFEDHYEKMEPHQQEEERLKLVETEVERLERVLAEDREKTEAEQWRQEVEAMGGGKTVEGLGAKPGPVVATKEKIPQTDLPKMEKVEEGIHMKFMAPNFFEEMIAGLDGLGSDDEGQS